MGKYLSPFLYELEPSGSEEGLVLLHWCPGCRSTHYFHVEKPNMSNAKWTWNGNVTSPTFTPSMDIRGHCHYFLENGILDFLPDSVHVYAGKKIPLQPIPTDADMLEDYLHWLRHQ